MERSLSNIQVAFKDGNMGHEISANLISGAWYVVGLHNFEKTSNCDYLHWYCHGDMICDTKRNDLFYIITLFFIGKHIKMIMVWFLQGISTKDVSLSLQNIMWRPGQLCSTAIFSLNGILTDFSPITIIVSPCDSKIVAGHIAISIKFRLIVQLY